ncbi:uncharacterized protein LOC143296876 [Babylonia areolata]|uniref:uncharacterized protein LOC143296876 n=1 Tax=Babylonia areolata TaxID=304850 RepID=UPI003FD5C1B8
MASTREALSQQQCHAGSSHSGRDGLTVLNAASHLVLERTIVEAFVKLVVCRRVTVQRVATASGQVLDSRTTQEEETPVILDVHRYEVGGDCPTRRSFLRQYAASDSLRCDCTGQPPSQPGHRGKEKASEDRTGDRRDAHSDPPSPKAWQSSDCIQRRGSVEGSPCTENKPGESGKGFHRKHHPHKLHRTVCKRAGVKVEQAGQEKGVKTGVEPHKVCREKREQGDNSRGVVMPVPKVSRADPAQNETTQAAADCCASGGDSRGNRMNSCAGLVSAIQDGQLPSHDSPQLDPLTTAEREESTQEMNEAVGEEDSVLLGEELMEEGSAETNKGREQGPEAHCESGEGSEQWTECSSNRIDGQDDANMASSDHGDAASEPRRQPGNKHENISGHSKYETNKPFGSDLKHAKVSINHDKGKCVSTPATSSSQHSEVHMEGSESSDSNSQPHKPSQPPDYDMEQDMLVIDISHTVMEQTQHSTDTEQTLSNTDGELTQPSTDSEPTHPMTDSEQTHAHTDSELIHKNTDTHSQTHDNTDTSAFTCSLERRTQSAEKPDPFFHLLTNFPVRDGSHSKASQSKSPKQGKAKSHRFRAASDSSAVYSSDPDRDLKEELDDDCMITAAFITPAVEGRGPQHRPAPHTVTSSQRGAVSGRGWRGRGAFEGAAARPRHNVNQQYHHPSTMMQFQQPVQGYQVDPNTAVAATAAAAAVGYQARPSSHTEPSSVPPPVTMPLSSSQAYIPNFLAATTSEVSEPVMDSGRGGALLPVPPEDRGAPMDLSETFQCPLCNKIFMHKNKFTRHTAICGGRRPFKCKICSKAFNQRAHLDTHLKFHMGIKRYRCDVCRKAYVMKGDLIRHLKTRAHLLVSQSCGLPVQ